MQRVVIDKLVLVVDELVLPFSMVCLGKAIGVRMLVVVDTLVVVGKLVAEVVRRLAVAHRLAAVQHKLVVVRKLVVARKLAVELEQHSDKQMVPVPTSKEEDIEEFHFIHFLFLGIHEKYVRQTKNANLSFQLHAKQYLTCMRHQEVKFFLLCLFLLV